MSGGADISNGGEDGSLRGDDESSRNDDGSTESPTTPFAVVETLSGEAEVVREWILLHGNRLFVAGGVLVILFVVLLGVERLGLIPMESQQPLFYVFSGLISGNLTLITVVVSINQLLLGREFNSPGALQSEIQNVVEYRETVEESAGQIAPVKPLGFLELLFETTRRQAQRIGGMTYGTVDEEVREEVDDTVESLTEHVDGALDLLRMSDPDTFEVLSATLTTNYAEDINRIRRIRANYGDDLPESVMDALEDLIDSLENVDVARQYFKSVYLMEELSSLSRVLLYAGLPAETVAVVALLALTTRSGTAITQHLELVVPFAVTVGFLPLALLFAFILRTATVTDRTAATVPFTTPNQEQ